MVYIIELMKTGNYTHIVANPPDFILQVFNGLKKDKTVVNKKDIWFIITTIINGKKDLINKIFDKAYPDGSVATFTFLQY